MPYQLFFTRDTQAIALPVLPQELPTQRSHCNETYNTIGLGEIMVPHLPALKVVTIDSYFPYESNPNQYIQFFQQAMADKAPIVYTPMGQHPNGSIYYVGEGGCSVLVTAFHTQERGGEPGDIYYTLEFTEYRDYRPKTVQVQQSDTAPNPLQDTGRGGDSNTITVGCTCLANGPYWYTSYGAKPYGTASNKTVVVSRMVDPARAAPIHVTTTAGGPLGWMAKSSLQVVTG